MSGIVARLRDPCFDSKCGKVRREAADRVQRLEAELEVRTAERDELRRKLDVAYARLDACLSAGGG